MHRIHNKKAIIMMIKNAVRIRKSHCFYGYFPKGPQELVKLSYGDIRNRFNDLSITSFSLKNECDSIEKNKISQGFALRSLGQSISKP